MCSWSMMDKGSREWARQCAQACLTILPRTVLQYWTLDANTYEYNIYPDDRWAMGC